jgi:serine protease
VVCAAGNNARGQVEYPAAYPGAVAVAALGPDGTKAPYSSWGKELDISAPGGDKRAGPEGGILQNTIDPQNPAQSVYASYQGTSMATPHVAGVAALLYAQGAESPDEVEQALFDGAKQIGGKAWSEQYGHGGLNAQTSLDALGRGTGGVDWHPLWWAFPLLAGVLVSIGRKMRPGYLNVLFSPKFAIPLMLTTVGAFFLRWISGRFGGSAEAMLDSAAIPLPDWQKIIFGRGSLANPLFYSALIPIVGAVIAVAVKGLRPVMAGLAIGFAAFLAYAAWAKAPALAYLPLTFLARPWLVVNALVCAFMSRALLRKESA